MPKYKKIEQTTVDNAREYFIEHSPKPVKERLVADDLEVVDFYHDTGILRTPAQHDIMWAIWDKNGRKVETREERSIRLEAERQATIELNKQKRLDLELAEIEAQKQAVLEREANKEAEITRSLATAEAKVKREKARLAAIAAQKKKILAAESTVVVKEPEPVPIPEPEEKTIDELIDEV